MAIQAYSLSKEGYKQLSPNFRVREFRCRSSAARMAATPSL